MLFFSLSLNTFCFFFLFLKGKHDFTCSPQTPLLHDSHMLVKRLKSVASVGSKRFQHTTVHKSPALCKYSVGIIQGKKATLHILVFICLLFFIDSDWTISVDLSCSSLHFLQVFCESKHFLICWQQ